MVFKVLTEAQKKNKYKIYYITRDNDSKDSQVISAYSEKQAVELLRKFNYNIYRITEVDCIEDHSKDDGEQLSLFEDKKMNFKILKENKDTNKKLNSLIKLESKDSASGSVDDYLNKMNNKTQAEVEKILKQARGNPNADKAYGIWKDTIKSTTYGSLKEDTVKQDKKWVNKGKEGTHGKFRTKKEADAQRKAMFANGYKEGLKEADYTYTGEPSDWAENGRSIWNNPKDWEHKLSMVKDLLKDYPNVKIYASSPWGVSITDLSGKNKLYKFDFWEDNQSILDQLNDCDYILHNSIHPEENLKERLDNSDKLNLSSAIYDAVSDVIFKSGHLDVDEKDVQFAFDKFIKKFFLDESMKEDLEDKDMKESDYIVWYNLDGEEDYEIVSAISVDDAKEKFSKNLDPSLIIDVHEIADDEDIHTESLNEAEDKSHYNATEVVIGLYDNFPNIDFIDEHDTDDGQVALKFEGVSKVDTVELGSYLDSLHVWYKIKGDKLLVKADEASEYEESLNESETDPGWEDPAWRKYFGVDDDSFYDEQEEVIEPEDVEDIYSLNDLDD